MTSSRNFFHRIVARGSHAAAARAPLALLLSLALTACSAKIESDGLSTPAGGTFDAGASPPPAPSMTGDSDAAAAAPSDGGAAVYDLPRCGPPPYRTLRLGARDIMAPAARGAVEGVEVRFKHCPTETFALPSSRQGGELQVLVSLGAETSIRFAAPEYLPWIEGELLIPDGAEPVSIEATLVPRALAATVLPGWKAEAPLVYVEVRGGRTAASEACRSPAGVTIAVKGQPTADVQYRDRSANGNYVTDPARGTSDEGVALITNLSRALPFIELTALKPGCSYQPAFGDANSPELMPLVRAPLEAGAITHQVVNPVR